MVVVGGGGECFEFTVKMYEMDISAHEYIYMTG